MDLKDLETSTSTRGCYGYIYHTVYKRPTDGKLFHYIGQHAKPEFSKTYKGSGHILIKLTQKYGKQHATHFCVTWCRSKAELDAAEIHFIGEARRVFKKRCINLTDGGSNGKHSVRTKKQLSKIHRYMPRGGNPLNWRHTDAAREKMSASHSGKVLSETHKERIAIAAKIAAELFIDLEARGKAISTSLKNSKKMKYKKALTLIKNEEADKAKELRRLAREEMSRIVRLMREDFYALWKQDHVDPRKGKKRATETCPHCGFTGGQGNMQRWHFDNCKKLKRPQTKLP